MFAFSGEAKPKKYAVEILHECHEAWKKLIAGESPAGDIALKNTTLTGAKNFVAAAEAAAQVPAANVQPAAPIDPSISKSFFISSATA